MVVIEVEESNVNPPKPAPSSTSHNASDGFETASDGELPSDDDNDDNGGDATNTVNAQQQEDHQIVPPQPQPEEHDEADSSSQNNDALQQQQKALEQENDAKALEQANDAKLEGNKLFGDGQFEEALSQYELALQVAPDMPSSSELRSICHANRAICYTKLGKYDETIKECTKSLELNPTYMKSLVRRGEAHEKLEHFEEAIADMKKILELDPSNDQARKTIHRLEPLAAEKREKMKEEMISKLKDMGNSLLGRFGMSVDNFKAVKDPNTGSYSVSFQR
ncbi:tetratricopeptide repeat protein 1 isoform X2 [Quercus lobata]|uniref:tetratricopeptide repeat protein 1 isoform X2 n=1 Tax=Quercus lobata TaxID=97700 RepID=UPI0012440676|nr:tetratricopeptide repeat protein 1 isoform X2 [Quercus lobata]